MARRKLPWMAFLLATTAVLWMGQCQALATRRALVIGNSAYRWCNPLKNPHNDADLMEKTLRSVGFEVTKRYDLTAQQMRAILRDFRAQLIENDIAVVYYSGHGIQVKGENLLVPVDFNAKFEYEVGEGTLSLATVIDALGDARARPKLIILDCCRNAPQFISLTRDFHQGLAEVKPSDDETLVCFATKDGSVAQDNPDRPNSTYTGALATALLRPNQKVEDVMKDVARTVRASSGGSQIPYVYGNLTDDFYFGGNTSPSGQSQITGPSSDQNGQVAQQLSEMRQELEAMKRASTAATSPAPQDPATQPQSIQDDSTSRRTASEQSSVPSSFDAFFKQMLRDQLSNDPSEWASDFAPSVDYCYKDGGPASQSYIRNDRAKLINIYPVRKYKLGEVENTRVISPSEVQMTYTFSYIYTGKKQAVGRCREIFTAELNGGRWQITSFNETVDRN